jgi:hypothetical protein
MKKPLSKKYSAHHTIPAYHQFTIAKYLLNKYTMYISRPHPTEESHATTTIFGNSGEPRRLASASGL